MDKATVEQPTRADAQARQLSSLDMRMKKPEFSRSGGEQRTRT